MPYNRFLYYKYRAYINIKLYYSFQTIQYLYKYLYKGKDRSTMEVTFNKTIKYINRRYLGASKVCQRLIGFVINGMVLVVMPLIIHVEGDYSIIYNKEIDNGQLSNVANAYITLLMDFFQQY